VRGQDARHADVKDKRAIHVEAVAPAAAPVPDAPADGPPSPRSVSAKPPPAMSPEETAEVLATVLPLLSLPEPTPSFHQVCLC